MVGLFQEAGPCEVVEIAKGQIGTQARQWGWDRSSNVIFIDQPNQVGFSYDTPTNGSLNLLNGAFYFPPQTGPSGQPPYTFLEGAFSSNNGTATANTTAIAAQAIWHMLQGFLGTFPQYNPGTRPNSTQSGIVGVNLFAESYGGKYGPAFASFWESQNALRRIGVIPSNRTLEIQLRSLGIMQGCVDDLVQGRYYPIFAYNNTYGIQAISLVDQQTAADAFLSANGCQQLVQACRDAVTSQDPFDEGDVDAVNKICNSAYKSCNDQVIGPYTHSGRSVYNISQNQLNPFPPDTYLEYLNSAAVQAAIGSPVNYTQDNAGVYEAFLQTGDYERGDQISQLSDLLAAGVRVALIYGDRDYICNWLGGEAVSFSVAGATIPTYYPFYAAGYAPIVVNSSYIGGVVREYGNLSFSRIYDSGHLIPAYQPETAFTVFTRIIMGTDVSTGEPINLSTFGTSGDANATATNSAPLTADPTCYLRAVDTTCSNDQRNMLQNGDGVIINGVLYSKESDWMPPGSSNQAGTPGSVKGSSKTAGSGSGSAASATSGLPTGVYVATATPTMSAKKTGGASARVMGDVRPVLEIGVLLLVTAVVSL